MKRISPVNTIIIAIIIVILNIVHNAIASRHTLKIKPLLTTTVGAFPKPDYVSLPDWFDNLKNIEPSKAYEQYLQTHIDNQKILDRATSTVVLDQVQVGIDIPTDGEVRRENYIYYHCRHLNGIDFSRLTKKVMRNGTWEALVPTITGPIKAQASFLPRDFQVAQQVTTHPIKITIPGPMTIADSLADAYYEDEEKLGAALAAALNQEILALVQAGCRWIQIDEPVFARYPDKALRFGIKHIERCFNNIPDHITSIIHICCGYPTKVDQENYPKANPATYYTLAKTLDNAAIKAVSIEDAHRHNDLTLLEHFHHTIVILGVIDISQTRIESVEEIEKHIREALQHIDADRLMLAPDCGLGLLSHTVILAKLSNMTQAAHAVRKQLATI